MNNTLLKQIKSIIEDETDLIANLANISAVINMNTEDINWVGFYLYKDDELVLGPFQGNVACTRLKEKGVCIHALKTNTIQNIPDVNQFEGHVVCDANSKSELVIPIYINNQPFGVLDIDSPIYNRFTQEDENLFKEIVQLLIKQMEPTI